MILLSPDSLNDSDSDSDHGPYVTPHHLHGMGQRGSDSDLSRRVGRAPHSLAHPRLWIRRVHRGNQLPSERATRAPHSCKERRRSQPLSLPLLRKKAHLREFGRDAILDEHKKFEMGINIFDLREQSGTKRKRNAAKQASLHMSRVVAELANTAVSGRMFVPSFEETMELARLQSANPNVIIIDDTVVSKHSVDPEDRPDARELSDPDPAWGKKVSKSTALITAACASKFKRRRTVIIVESEEEEEDDQPTFTYVPTGEAGPSSSALTPSSFVCPN